MARYFLVIVAAIFMLGSLAEASVDPQQIEQISGIDDHRGAQIDLSLKFTDENGRVATLEEHRIANRPFILAPVYYSCPHLCTLTLNGLTELLKQLDLKMGSDFSVLAYTIKPEETVDLALKKRANYLKELGPTVPGQDTWHFLTGDVDSIAKLSSAIGFKYQKDGEEYAHAAGLLVLTPDGHISKYLYSVTYDPGEARKALVDASEGRIGSIGERIFLFCFRYDHFSGKYTPIIMNIVRAVSAVVVVLLFGSLLLLRLREVRKVGKIA